MAQHGIPKINSEELQAFLVVAQYQSFVAAAIRLNMSQPTLTRLIQNLEKQLNVTLFKRNTRAVQITPEGLELVAISERLLNDLRIGTKRIQNISQDERGQLIISSVMSVAHSSLANLVSQFHTTYPMVEIFIREGVHGIVLEEVRSGAADIGITYIEGLPDSVKVIKLGKESFHVIFKKDHKLSLKNGVRLSDLRDEDLISMPSNSRTRISIDSAASLLGLRLNYVVTVGQFGTMLQFVNGGIGVALVPEGVLSQVDRSLIDSRPIISPKFSRALGIISLKERDLSTYASVFSTLIKKNLKLK
jgi:DNA-binding transcriptional LysR family regulator